ncbi:MAG: hypothetical protein V1678_03515 [Candidatus Aenigmatarchaeota archaeon]
MEVKSLKWEYVPKENPDWDFARTPFTVIKRPQATWSQSIFSSRHESLIAPNRDYRYQGLNVMVGGEYWKFLDSVFFGIKDTVLEPVNVITFPWKSVYQYKGKGVEVDVEYYLAKDFKDGIAARVMFNVMCKGEKELLIKPLVDIRNAYTHSRPETIESKLCENGLLASVGGNNISFFLDNCETSSNRQVVNWRYKLGSGFREQTNDGIKMVSEWDNPLFIGEMVKKISDGEKLSLIINCNRNNETDFDGNEVIEKDYISTLIKLFGCKKEVMARIIAMDKFGIIDNESKTMIPEAGDFWFKQIWTRDLMEFCINNFNTMVKVDKNKVENIIRWTLGQQDQNSGRFPNFRGNFDSTDSGLLFFILAEKYLREFPEKSLATQVARSLNFLLKKFSENKFESDGQPVIHDGMLYSMPWHSWTDSRIPFYGRLISTRIPFEWTKEVDIEHLCKPALLPEINALYIRVLRAGETISGIAKSDDNFFNYYKNAISKYKKIFKNKRYLYSLILGDKKDSTETSMALVSAVLLHGHVFDSNDLKNMWPSVQNLLVKKRGKIFGMLARNTGEMAYLNDSQYHGSVVWPRDNPYLIRYLKLIGEDAKAREVLESNLWHQMDESAIFYSSELFSLPEGKNPSPTRTHNDPVPMKNPIQLWSHFCDAYLEDSSYTDDVRRSHHGL